MANSDLITVSLLDEFTRQLAQHLKNGDFKFENVSAENINVTGVLNGAGATATLKEVYVNAISGGDASFGTAILEELKSTHAEITSIDADVVTTEELQAAIIKVQSGYIKDLETDYLKVKSVIAGNVNAELGKFVHLTADTAQIDNSFIKDAMIDNISADKIASGTIYTNKVNVQSDDGNSKWIGNLFTMQQPDGIVRILIGKIPDSTDYNVVIFDKDGRELFNATGVTKEGLQGKIAETLNDDTSTVKINGGRIDVFSVVEKINEDESVTFQSSKVNYDGNTLDTYFAEKITGKDGVISKVTQLQNDYESIMATAQSAETKADENETKLASLELKPGSLTLQVSDIVENSETIKNFNQLIHVGAKCIIIASIGSPIKQVITASGDFFTNSQIDYENMDSVDPDTLNRIVRIDGDKNEMEANNFKGKEYRIGDNWVLKETSSGGFGLQ